MWFHGMCAQPQNGIMIYSHMCKVWQGQCPSITLQHNLCTGSLSLRDRSDVNSICCALQQRKDRQVNGSHITNRGTVCNKQGRKLHGEMCNSHKNNIGIKVPFVLHCQRFTSMDNNRWLKWQSLVAFSVYRNFTLGWDEALKLQPFEACQNFNTVVGSTGGEPS